jgi:hypothetical protein
MGVCKKCGAKSSKRWSPKVKPGRETNTRKEMKELITATETEARGLGVESRRLEDSWNGREGACDFPSWEVSS